MRGRSLVVAGSSVVAAVFFVAGCSRPPVTLPPDGGEGEGERTVIDLPGFLQDRPAIGGKWYDYSVDGHILEPKDEAWIVRDVDGAFHGFAIESVYDDDTGDSGVFTLDVVHRDGDGWGPASTYTSSANVKDGAPLCLRLATLVEQDCQGAGWDLRLVLQSRLSVFAGFAVAEPAVFLGDVVAARVDGVALADLPDPAGIADLDDGDAGYDSTEWDYGAFAPDLPKSGRVLGALAHVAGQRWAVVDGGRGLVEFSVVDDGDGALTFHLRRQPIDIDDFSAPADLGEFRDVVVDTSALPVFVSLREDDLLTPADKLATTSWPTQLPFARDYDVIVEDDSTGAPSLWLSPAAAARRQGPVE
jgi:hypothetical protein